MTNPVTTMEIDDSLYNDSVSLIRSTGKVSSSLLQSHLKMGYNRALEIIGRMEVDGIVSKCNHIGVRKVLL